MNNTIKNRTVEARRLGKEAFIKGLKRAPILNPKCMILIKDLDASAGNAVLISYLGGWDWANAK